MCLPEVRARPVRAVQVTDRAGRHDPQGAVGGGRRADAAPTAVRTPPRPRLEATVTRLGTHAFAADPDIAPDHRGRSYCTCGAPQDHERHTLPDMAEATAESRRRLGEGED